MILVSVQMVVDANLMAGFILYDCAKVFSVCAPCASSLPCEGTAIVQHLLCHQTAFFLNLTVGGHLL